MVYRKLASGLPHGSIVEFPPMPSPGRGFRGHGQALRPQNMHCQISS